MSWLSKWFHGGGKDEVLTQLAFALLDGKITADELRPILAKIGFGVVNAGMPGKIRKVYDLTDPNYLRNIGAKTVEDIISKVDVAHVLIGAILKEVE